MFITTRIGGFPLLKNSFVRSFHLIQPFSNLKDRFAELKKADYGTINEMYAGLRNFESKLTYNEWVKFKKLIHEADKKVRKFQREEGLNSNSENSQNPIQLSIPYTMDGSITCEYFYHKHTQGTFYKEEIPYHKIDQVQPKIKTLPINQIQKLIEHYTKNDMETYLFTILPCEQQFSEMMKLVRLRYLAVEEVLCRHIFKGYIEFTAGEENLFFKTEQKYKGNFKFYPLDPTASQQNKQIISQFSRIARNLACLNQCTPKIQLAVQTLLTQHWQNLDSQTISNLMFCTSVNGKDLHQVTTNIDQFSAKLLTQTNGKHYFTLLFYMCISVVENRQIFEKADQKLVEINKNINSFEKLILSGIVHYLSQVKQIDFIKLRKSELFEFPETESDCLKNFKKFLDEKQYKYEIIPHSDRANIISTFKMVEIQQKKFVCYSSQFYQPQNDSNTLNGLAKLINEYFKASNEKIKIINGKELSKIEKWTEKQEYLKTKMKGLTKPEVKRERKFDFYSPREEYFQKKESEK